MMLFMFSWTALERLEAVEQQLPEGTHSTRNLGRAEETLDDGADYIPEQVCHNEADQVIWNIELEARK